MRQFSLCLAHEMGLTAWRTGTFGWKYTPELHCCWDYSQARGHTGENFFFLTSIHCIIVIWNGRDQANSISILYRMVAADDLAPSHLFNHMQLWSTINDVSHPKIMYLIWDDYTIIVIADKHDNFCFPITDSIRSYPSEYFFAQNQTLSIWWCYVNFVIIVTWLRCFRFYWYLLSCRVMHVN